jgi:hypothetical protein
MNFDDPFDFFETNSKKDPNLEEIMDKVGSESFDWDKFAAVDDKNASEIKSSTSNLFNREKNE